MEENRQLKDYLPGELKSASVVYEKVYPNSVPVSQKKSFFFTELYTINPLIVPEIYRGKTLNEEEMQPYYKLKGAEDDTLIFESRFESGNLLLAIKKSETEYDLYLQNDINTQGNTQWFFFRVANTRKLSTIFFNIKNFVPTLLIYRPNLHPCLVAG